MKITFGVPKELVIVPEVKNSFSEIEVVEIIDKPSAKIVWAVTAQVGRIVLWKDDAYDTIGQWTDTDVVNRINELYAN